MPAAASPLKERGPVASGPERISMLQAATEAQPGFHVWTDEIDRSDGATPSYTIETVTRARVHLDRHGRSATRLRLLIGGDQAAGFHRWRSPREIIAIAEPIVALRTHERGPRGDADELLSTMRSVGFWSAEEIEAWRTRIVVTALRDVSASRIRDLLHHSATDHIELESMLHPRVLDHIRAAGLYGTQPVHHAAPDARISGTRP